MRIAKIVYSIAILVGIALGTVRTVAQTQLPPDFSKVEIKTTKLGNNFYTLEGVGGTTGVLVGPDGVFMVDDQFAPLSAKLVAAIKQLSDQPVRFVVNTHVHADHTGGNENFGKMGAIILAREELRDRLMHPLPAANGTPGVPAAAAALPLVTYEGVVKLHINGEVVELIPIPRAHTNGDTMVYFPGLDIIMTGDFYRSVQYPNIDRSGGGTLNGMLDALGVVIGMAGPNTKIVPGHGPVVGRAEVMATRDMMLVIRDRVAQLIAQGKTLEEVMAANPTADYDARVPNSKETTARFVTQLYGELKAGN